jgi:hypothetical protein
MPALLNFEHYIEKSTQVYQSEIRKNTGNPVNPGSPEKTGNPGKPGNHGKSSESL